MKTSLTLLLILGISGCATDWSRNLYEGVRQQRQAVPDPTDAQPASRNPDYEQYRREREALKDAPVR